MLNLTDLEQLVAFADYKTLTRVAEVLHISQPTLSRSMRRVEADFGVPLFTRGKNRLELNDTGSLAAEYARRLLADARRAVDAVQAFDRQQRSLTVCACAPKPLWHLLPRLAAQYPERQIVSRLEQPEAVLSAVQSGQADVGILPGPCPDGTLQSRPYLQEHLAVAVPPGHALFGRTSVTFADLNGFNCLLRDQIGFWAQLCYDEMPASKFLVQTEEAAFVELVHASTLLCFTTDLVENAGALLGDRQVVPITDRSANVQYYLIERPGSRVQLKME